MKPETARRDLDQCRASRPADPYEADVELRTLNERYLGGDRLAALHGGAADFGRRVMDVVGPAAARFSTAPPFRAAST